LSTIIAETLTERSRQRALQLMGVFCGLAAALWLAAAEAPTKLVTISVSPFVISFMMVLGAFISRWSLPALIRGTSDIAGDVRAAPHLVVWGILAGCLWAGGNTLTVFGVRDVGLSIAFPLWNSNSLIGIVWGIVFFRELRRAGWRRWVGVIGGAVIIFGGALMLSLASTSQTVSPHPLRGVAAALGAGMLLGSMYISYRKAYITGMNPLSFLTFFTFGEMGTVTALAVGFMGGATPLLHELVKFHTILFWPLLGGFMWVVGDLFQNFAAKYIGISRGIPLSNTNQLWGLLWGILVFGELRSAPHSVIVQVVSGSLLMAAGAAAIALSSATEHEYVSWKEAAQREIDFYQVDPAYVAKSMEGKEKSEAPFRRTWVDWSLVSGATAIFVGFGAMAAIPHIQMNWFYLAGLVSAMLVVLVACGAFMWRTTGFN
jgi:drug/metabolite transporter (DMT)-like permease